MSAPDFPLISIIVPAFNAARTIDATLESVSRQLFTNWECFVVDDGSTDETARIVRDWSKRDQRIRIASNPGKGPAAARNYGALRLANGALIAFCDADDICSPQKLSSAAQALRDPQTDAVYGQVAFFAEQPDKIRSKSTVLERPLEIQDLLAENPVCTMSNLTISAQSFRASGGFNENMVHNEDLEWLIRLVGDGAQITGIDQHHIWYRTSHNGLSADTMSMRAGREQVLKTAQRFGVKPNSKHEAIYLRYLARRALRIGSQGQFACRFAIEGFLRNPASFCFPLQRGLPTLAASLIAPILPRSLRLFLFSE